jgi:hypothetical protein
VTVVVERASPQLDLDVGRAVAGSVTPVSVVVTNPTESQIRNLTLTVGGPGVTTVDGRATIPSLAAGASQTVNLSVRPAAGQAAIEVDLSYTTATGVTQQTQRRRTVRVQPLENDVGVSVAPISREETQQGATDLQGLLTGGGTTTQQDQGDDRPTSVSVTVTNFGNAPVDTVVVTPRAGDRRLPRRALGEALAPGESASVTVDLSSIRRPGDVTFDVGYRIAGQSGDAVGTYEYRPEAGVVRLTGVSLAFEDGQLVVQGNAGNVGGADVEGVIVSVGDSEFVDPAYPQRNYFVGTVEGSEFAPFELTADVDRENVTVIPVVINYTVDGYEFSRTVEVPYDEDVEPEDDEGLGIPWLSVVVVVALAVIVGGGYLVWLRRED